MGIKVVQGLVGGTVKPNELKPSKDPSQLEGSTQKVINSQHHQSQIITRNITSDAVISNIKGVRSTQADKLRDFERAKELAEEVSEKIAEDPTAEDAHYALENLDPREHFRN